MTTKTMRCAVIGGGAWGTALANQLANNGHRVVLWAYEEEVALSINTTHINEKFLAGVQLNTALTATSKIEDAAADADLVVMVTPSHVCRAVAAQLEPYVPKAATVVVASKGIEQHSLSLMTEVVEHTLKCGPSVALSGPSFAVEVARSQPTAVVVASEDLERAKLVQHAISSPTFRAYTLTDVVGVELGGSLKNVMAVATGIAEGLGLGLNAQAALITRGLAEITRLGVSMGADQSTFAGLAGIGDLVLTCTGSLSRNRSVGNEIGKGKSLDEILASRDTVAEGVITTRSAYALAARQGVDMPIVAATYSVLFDGVTPKVAMGALLDRDLRSEIDD